MSAKKMEVAIFIIIILFITIFNKEIMPVRKEVTELELTTLIGMDAVNEGKYRVEQTIVRVEDTSSNSSSQGSSTSGSKKQTKLFSVKAVTFSDAIRSFQTYIDKSLTGSHIKHILLGEELTKNDIGLLIDFNARDYEIRLNADIYITKNTSARKFIENAVSDEYEISKKIDSMEKNNEAKSVIKETTFVDLLSILVDKDASGLIPTLRIISEKGEQTSTSDTSSDNIQDFQTPYLEKDTTDQSYFDFDGYAIIKNNVLIGYLSREDSITCNILKNVSKGTNINIDLGDDNIITFGILNSNTKYSFNYENGILSEVKIINKFQSNFDEISSKKDLFQVDQIEELEKKQAEQIKREIEKVVEKIKEYKADFLDIKKQAKLKNPYKFENIKDDWTNQLCNAKFIIETTCKINRTYDLLSLYGKGG